MGNRYGRQQKRRHRKEIAELQSQLKFKSRRIEQLQRDVEFERGQKNQFLDCYGRKLLEEATKLRLSFLVRDGIESIEGRWYDDLVRRLRELRMPPEFSVSVEERHASRCESVVIEFRLPAQSVTFTSYLGTRKELLEHRG